LLLPTERLRQQLAIDLLDQVGTEPVYEAAEEGGDESGGEGGDDAGGAGDESDALADAEPGGATFGKPTDETARVVGGEELCDAAGGPHLET
jgi:hypothetical protein